MNALTQQIINDIKTGRAPQVIQSVDRIFVITRADKWTLHGHVCGIIGSYVSKPKIVNIQTAKNGARYVMADRVRFNLERLKPCDISREFVEKELDTCRGLKKMYEDMKKDGIDPGFGIENQDFFIKNIVAYLDGRERHAV